MFLFGHSFVDFRNSINWASAFIIVRPSSASYFTIFSSILLRYFSILMRIFTTSITIVRSLLTNQTTFEAPRFILTVVKDVFPFPVARTHLALVFALVGESSSIFDQCMQFMEEWPIYSLATTRLRSDTAFFLQHALPIPLIYIFDDDIK